jgi:uncharacterized membrane protein
MSWIYLALWAYFLNAISFIIDKYLLAAPIPKPFVYAFWVAMLSAVAVVLIPFGVTWIGVFDMTWAFLSGLLFFFGLICFYKSLKHGDVSVGATKAGTFMVLFSYIFSSLILGAHTTSINLPASILLLIGISILAQTGKSILPYSIASGALMSLSFVLLKFVFVNTTLINGIFWSRMGFVLSALIALLFSDLRSQIVASFKTPRRSRAVFVLNKVIAGCGFIALYYAIQLGNVALINSLLGFQFVFVFLLALAFRRIIPGVGEYIDSRTIWQKVTGIIFVTLGFLQVFFG